MSAKPPDDGPPSPALGEELDFLRLIWAVDHALQRTSKRMEMTMGITSPQRLVLRIAARFPGIPAGHLAKLLHVHPSTLTGIMKRLEQQGMIRRRPDPGDGRRALIGLTKKGRDFDVKTEGLVERAIRRMLASTPPQKVHAARQVLESIAENLPLDEPGAKPGRGRRAGGPLR